MLDTYQLNLAGLLLVCGTLLAVRSGSEAEGEVVAEKTKDGAKKQYVNPYRGSQWAFFAVYACVMGADWLQGPFLYPLYREQYGVSAGIVTQLFTTGFISGALSASVTGRLADSKGRRAACLFFCVAYTLSCVLTMVNSVPVLFTGRVLGGISTSLLFSVFESWMVTDFHSRHLEKKGLNLSRTFGTMSTINSVTAIASGLISEWLVTVTGTKKAPFAASIGLLVVAFLLIYGQWDENYGEVATKSKSQSQGPSKLRATLTNRHVLSLGLASTMLEGSMYLYVFFWAPALKGARVTDLVKTGVKVKAASAQANLPYGIIFASFMAAMMAASLTFNLIMSKRVLSYTQLLLAILGISDACFFYLIRPRSEQVTFWLFCAFEACVGMYWPCVGYLKGRLVEDSVRAQVYGIMRIPVNVFVVLSLLLTGDPDAYKLVFALCALLLSTSVGTLFLTSRGEAMP